MVALERKKNKNDKALELHTVNLLIIGLQLCVFATFDRYLNGRFCQIH